VYKISWELLNGFAPNSQGRHIWSLICTSLNVKVTRHKKHTVHSNHPLSATEWNVLAVNNIIRQQMGPFHHCRGVI